MSKLSLLAGCSIRCAGVQQVPQAASLWVMACQDPSRPPSVLSVQHRQAARKAAKSGMQPAQPVLADLLACMLQHQYSVSNGGVSSQTRRSALHRSSSEHNLYGRAA